MKKVAGQVALVLMVVYATVLIAASSDTDANIKTGRRGVVDSTLSTVGSLFELLAHEADPRIKSHLLVKPITLTNDLTITKEIHQVNGAVITTNRHILIIRKDSPHGDYQRFDAAPGEVLFRGTSPKVKTVWFGQDMTGEMYSTMQCQAAHDSLPIGLSISNHTKPAGTVIYTGKAKVDGTIFYTACTTIEGYGTDASVVVNTTTDKDTFKPKQAPGNARHVVFKDLSIDGSTSATAGAAINLDDGTSYGSRFEIRNVNIIGHYNGIKFKDSIVAVADHIIVTRSASDGFLSEGTAHALSIRNTYACSCSGHGYNLAGNYISLFNTAADGNGGDGYHIRDGAGVISLNTIGAEDNAGHGINAYTHNSSVIGPAYIITSGSDGIKLNSGDWIITGSYASGNAGYGLNKAPSSTVVVIGGYFTGKAGGISDLTNLTTLGYAALSGLGINGVNSRLLAITSPTGTEDIGYLAQSGIGSYKFGIDGGLFFKHDDAKSVVFRGDAMRGAIRADSTGMKSDGKVRGVAGLGVGNSTDGDVTGNAKTKKIEVFDSDGVSLGFIQVYAGP